MIIGGKAIGVILMLNMQMLNFRQENTLFKHYMLKDVVMEDKIFNLVKMELLMFNLQPKIFQIQ